MVRFIMHDIMNILEDGYIEQRMIAEYPLTNERRGVFGTGQRRHAPITR